MKFSLDAKPVCENLTDCLVVAVSEDGALGPAAAAVDDACEGLITKLRESGDIETGIGKCTLLHRVQGIAAQRLLLVGLGKQDKLDLPRFDRACLAAGKFLRDHPVTGCHVCLHDHEFGTAGPASRLRQAALAIHRSNYLYTVTKPRKESSPAPLKAASFQDGKYQDFGILIGVASNLGFISFD